MQEELEHLNEASEEINQLELQLEVSEALKCISLRSIKCHERTKKDVLKNTNTIQLCEDVSKKMVQNLCHNKM